MGGGASPAPVERLENKPPPQGKESLEDLFERQRNTHERHQSLLAPAALPNGAERNDPSSHMTMATLGPNQSRHEDKAKTGRLSKDQALLSTSFVHSHRAESGCVGYAKDLTDEPAKVLTKDFRKLVLRRNSDSAVPGPRDFKSAVGTLVHATKGPDAVQGGKAGRHVVVDEAEVERVKEEGEKVQEEGVEQVKRHEEERELIWRRGLELRVEVGRMKKAKEVAVREMREQEKRHRMECMWARHKMLELEDEVKSMQGRVDELKKEKADRLDEQRLEAELIERSVLGLQERLAALRQEKEEVETEGRKHLQSCKMARRQVLQLQQEIESLTKEVREKREEGEASRGHREADHALVMGEIARLQKERDELMLKKEEVDVVSGTEEALLSGYEMAAAEKVNLHHEVEELKRTLKLQQLAQEKARQNHLKKCKLLHKEAMKLKQEREELLRKVEEDRLEMKELQERQESEGACAEMEMMGLKKEVQALKLQHQVQGLEGGTEGSAVDAGTVV